MACGINNRNVITLTETDEVDSPTATYVYSESGSPHSGVGRIDVVNSSSSSFSPWSRTSLQNPLVNIFLPAGYPHSVSDDYLQYQIFDSLQAFCSSIAGLLSSRAVLQGVGVGNASASPTSALLLHILQDTSGRIATIFFAHRVGTALEPECKMYRLAADVFNDLAMILDCLSPLAPAGVSRVTVLSTAGVLRALCGVAGGSSKASLSAHFARWGNLAEVNAKDSSQETIISLLGMLVGSFVVSHVTGFAATWVAFLALLSLHLGSNYAAVRAVHMTSLNRQRTNIVFSALFASDQDLNLDDLGGHGASKRTSGIDEKQWTVLRPAEVASRERIFTRGEILTWTPVDGPSSSTTATTYKLGSCRIGVPLQCLLSEPPFLSTSIPIPHLISLFASESYLLFFTYSSKGTWEGTIILKSGCTAPSQIKSWAHALLAARVLRGSLTASGEHHHDSREKRDDQVLRVMSQTLNFLNEGYRFEKYAQALMGAGWNMELAALETKPGRRIRSDME